MSEDIKKIREKIDSLDDDILDLFNQRAQQAVLIAQEKQKSKIEKQQQQIEICFTTTKQIQIKIKLTTNTKTKNINHFFLLTTNTKSINQKNGDSFQTNYLFCSYL